MFWELNHLISFIHHCHIHILCSITLYLPISIMCMSKYVQLGFDLFYFLFQFFASKMNPITRLIQNAKGCSMSNKDVYFIGQTPPNLLSSRLMILKAPIKKQRLIRWSKYLNSIYFYQLMLKIDAWFF
jgi:hypothetical protein